MNREEFSKITDGKILYLDGATGSNLVKAGMPSGVCPEKWILENREVMLQLQKDYVNAGTDILYAPTFTANRLKLAEYHLEKELVPMVKKLVSISQEAAQSAKDHKVYVAGDITMCGEPLEPVGHMDLETLIGIYKEEIQALVSAGVDLLVVETMMSLAETRAAVIAAKEVCDLPVMATLTFEADGRTLYGTDATTAAIVLENLGVSAIGVNCSTGPSNMVNCVKDMCAVTQIPIIAKPNAGLPCLDESGNTYYDMSSEQFAEEMKLLVDAGASILGGCCGTDSSYIKRICEKFGHNQEVCPMRKPQNIRYLCSERMTLSFGLDDGFFIVGERINPTGKKALQAQLRKGNFDMVLQFAEEQEQCGASVLDINMGMSGIDEKEMMLRAISEVSGVTHLPLSLDSSYVDVLESALRNYPGRALVNSVSMEKEKIEKLLPLVKKYGAMFILLPLSDEGLPENLEKKLEIIDTIYERALSLGLTREDIIVDGLVTTVGANKKAALETLETIRTAKQKGLATICGLSNISFGMPARGYINSAFLTMAIKEGLTCAIANPSQDLLVTCAFATDLLLNKDNADLKYIEYTDFVKEKKEKEAVKAATEAQVIPEKKAENISVSDEEANIQKALTSEYKKQLFHAVLKGNRNNIANLTNQALSQGEKADELLNEVLLPAINQVGDYFDKGKYFLPQLIASAEAMKASIEVLEPYLAVDNAGDDMPVVVIATVEGDIHDIGKNLVALMLKNYGFKVIDLGKDVPKEEILKAAKEHNAKIIALSALMTTTMQRMREVVEEVKKEQLSVKVMIGGAVITQEYADEIGADGYSKDAADAVKLAKRLNS